MPKRAVRPTSASGSRERRRPVQNRSRELVRAIREASLEILRDEGFQALTTRRIAERAGVSVGSLYQYFADKEEILSAVYEWQSQQHFDRGESWAEELMALGVPELVKRVVRAVVGRHRHFLRMHPDYYREHWDEFQLGTRSVDALGSDGGGVGTWFFRQVLEARQHELCDVDVAHAAWLVPAGISSLLRATLRDDPERLFDDAFVDEVCALFVTYLVGVRPAAGALPENVNRPAPAPGSERKKRDPERS